MLPPEKCQSLTAKCYHQQSVKVLQLGVTASKVSKCYSKMLAPAKCQSVLQQSVTASKVLQCYSKMLALVKCQSVTAKCYSVTAK